MLRPEVLREGYTQMLDLFADQKPREYGIELTSASRQDDVFDITLPDGVVLDGQSAPVNFSCEFATYSSKAEMNGNVLHYVRTLEIQKVHVPKERVGDLKEFLQKVASDQGMYIALKPAGS